MATDLDMAKDSCAELTPYFIQSAFSFYGTLDGTETNKNIDAPNKLGYAWISNNSTKSYFKINLPVYNLFLMIVHIIFIVGTDQMIDIWLI